MKMMRRTTGSDIAKDGLREMTGVKENGLIAKYPEVLYLKCCDTLSLTSERMTELMLVIVALSILVAWYSVTCCREIYTEHPRDILVSLRSLVRHLKTATLMF